MTSDSTRHELIDFVSSSSCQSRSNQNIKLGGECKTVLSSVDLTGHLAKKKIISNLYLQMLNYLIVCFLKLVSLFPHVPQSCLSSSQRSINLQLKFNLWLLLNYLRNFNSWKVVKYCDWLFSQPCFHPNSVGNNLFGSS